MNEETDIINDQFYDEFRFTINLACVPFDMAVRMQYNKNDSDPEEVLP